MPGTITVIDFAQHLLEDSEGNAIINSDGDNVVDSTPSPQIAPATGTVTYLVEATGTVTPLVETTGTIRSI